eukprot:gene1432-biopygen6071
MCISELDIWLDGNRHNKPQFGRQLGGARFPGPDQTQFRQQFDGPDSDQILSAPDVECACAPEVADRGGGPRGPPQRGEVHRKTPRRVLRVVQRDGDVAAGEVARVHAAHVDVLASAGFDFAMVRGVGGSLRRLGV